jgi:hypothetical protein
MRTTNRTSLATTVTLGAVCTMLVTAALADAQIIIPTNPQLPRVRAYRALDLGVAGDAGALNNEAGNDLTATFEERRFIQGVQRNIPVIHTIDDACRDRFDLDTVPGLALSINDSRIVVGSRGGDAFEWFPSQCPNVVQSGALPRLPSFLGARATANNNTRDAVGVTSMFSATTIVEFPTLWRKVTGGFTVAQLQTAFRPAPLNNLRQPGAALDINEGGTIVGFTRVGNDSFNRAAILHENQDPDILRLFGANDVLFRLNAAHGISNNGYITGIATRILAAGASGVQTRGFVRSPGGTIRGTLIPDLNGTFIGSIAHKVNDSGFAVGRLLKNDGGTAAALWNEEGEVAMLDSSNVDDLPQGAVLTDAVDINDHGAILAKGLVNGELHVFILRFRGTFLIFKSASQSY